MNLQPQIEAIAVLPTKPSCHNLTFWSSSWRVFQLWIRLSILHLWVHFVGCVGKPKSQGYIFLKNVWKLKQFWKLLGGKSFVLKIPGWESVNFVCGFTNQYLKKAEASAVSAALLNLWITVCVEKSKFPSSVVKIFDEIAKINKMIPKQIIRKAPPKGKREVKQPKFKYFALQVFYDSFGHVDPHIVGSGYVIIKKGLEVGSGFETIPLNSNNLGWVFRMLSWSTTSYWFWATYRNGGRL